MMNDFSPASGARDDEPLVPSPADEGTSVPPDRVPSLGRALKALEERAAAPVAALVRPASEPEAVPPVEDAPIEAAWIASKVRPSTVIGEDQRDAAYSAFIASKVRAVAALQAAEPPTIDVAVSTPTEERPATARAAPAAEAPSGVPIPPAPDLVAPAAAKEVAPQLQKGGGGGGASGLTSHAST